MNESALGHLIVVRDPYRATRDRRGPTDCLRLVEDPNRRAGLSRGERSHQAGASGAEHHNVVKRILWILH